MSFAKVAALFDDALGLGGRSERDHALRVETLHAFLPRMPWIYAILIVNLSGLLAATHDSLTYLTSAGVVLLVVLAVRLVHWTLLPKRSLSETDVGKELRNIFIVGALLCTGYCLWTFALYAQSDIEDRNHIVLFASLAALGCSFALSPMPSASKMPLYLLALPLAVLLISTRQIAFMGMGATLLTLIYVALRLIKAENVTFRRLVNSRFDLELEKRRAEGAERSALRERSLARKLAETDVLTGLANRRALLGKIEAHARGRVERLAVALVDLDGFKPVNDTFGHGAGDALLVEISQRLRAIIDPLGTVARLGGDEFAVLLPDCDETDARAVIAEVMAEIERPCRYEGRTLRVSACAGIACGLADEHDPTKPIRMADIALFAAKSNGRGKLEVYMHELETEIARRAEIEIALRGSQIEEEIDVAFQPILDLEALEVRSFEALARWKHSKLGWISPSEFIPISEKISALEILTPILLRRASTEASRWPARIRLSFNMSAVELCSERSADQIIDLVSGGGLDPRRLQIEVTETAILADFDAARRNLAALRERGVLIVLDDFGAGFASISYLREMQFDAVKLDGSLLTAATPEAGGIPLLRGVLELCRSVGLPCVAEHVETEDQVAMLRHLGCTYGQGYWLAPPLSAESAHQLAHSELIPFGPARMLKQRTPTTREPVRAQH